MITKDLVPLPSELLLPIFDFLDLLDQAFEGALCGREDGGGLVRERHRAIGQRRGFIGKRRRFF